MLTVNEIFHSVQGESTRAGEPCVFIRLTACNLRCRWCDTTYAFYEGTKRPVGEVVDQVVAYGSRLVEVTGGEPLLQEGVYELFDRLLAAGRTVLVETGGHMTTVRVPPGVITILDVKCPASGEAARMDWSNVERLSPEDEVKFVVEDRGDYEYARDVVHRYDLASTCRAVLLSPVHGVLRPDLLADWILADRLPARLQLQLHKYIWHPQTRGV